MQRQRNEKHTKMTTKKRKRKNREIFKAIEKIRSENEQSRFAGRGGREN